jgi:hypothetical protein
MNEKLKPNFTQIPNVFFDEIYSKLGFAELKVLLYLMRRTYGFHKKTDRISLTQFESGIEGLDVGTGLARKNIISALSSLEEKKIVIKNKNKYVTSYSLYLDSDLKLVTQSNQTSYAELPELVTQSNPQKKGNKVKQKKEIQTSQKVENSLTYLKDLPEEHISYFTKKYKLGKTQLTTKGEQLYNWVVQKGKEKEYKNFKALLENAVLKDFGKRESDILNY